MTECLELSVRHVLTNPLPTNLNLLLLPHSMPPLLLLPLLRLLVKQQLCDGQQDVPAVCC
jgi:hypothetical protein